MSGLTSIQRGLLASGGALVALLIFVGVFRSRQRTERAPQTCDVCEQELTFSMKRSESQARSHAIYLEELALTFCLCAQTSLETLFGDPEGPSGMSRTKPLPRGGSLVRLPSSLLTPTTAAAPLLADEPQSPDHGLQRLRPLGRSRSDYP